MERLLPVGVGECQLEKRVGVRIKKIINEGGVMIW